LATVDELDFAVVVFRGFWKDHQTVVESIPKCVSLLFWYWMITYRQPNICEVNKCFDFTKFTKRFKNSENFNLTNTYSFTLYSNSFKEIVTSKSTWHGFDIKMNLHFIKYTLLQFKIPCVNYMSVYTLKRLS